MNSSEIGPEAPDLVRELDNVQSMVAALPSVRWKCHQDALMELPELGVVFIVEEIGCLRAKVYLQKEIILVVPLADDDTLSMKALDSATKLLQFSG